MIEVQYDAGRCQILRDGEQLCDLSIDEAIAVRDQITKDEEPNDTASADTCA